jgi:hypothetical protein
MNDPFVIPRELFTTFNDITFHDEPHKYFLDGRELISVTTLIHQYQEEFNEDYWSNYKADQFRITQNEILAAWKFINRKGVVKGSAIHDYAEKLFQNKSYEYPKDLILKEFGFDPVWNEYQITKKHVDRFYKDVHDRLIPVRTELVIYDKESMIAGMLDILFYNIKMKEFQIWDWKTNKDFTFEMKSRHLLKDLFTLEDCDLETYSLQLELYKRIIERNTPVKLGKSYIVWFSHNNENYQVIEVRDRGYFIDRIMENRIAELVV